MIQSDALLWRPDHGINESTRKEEQVLLPDKLFINLLDNDLQNSILDAKDMDINIKSIIKTIIKEGPTNMWDNLADWKIEEVDGWKTIFYKGKNYIPKDQELWWDMFKMFYDHETAGDPGELEAYNLVKQHYWWPGIWMFIKNYIQGCGICQQFKINHSSATSAYQAIERAKTTWPFAYCSMDLITDLPTANRYDSILVMVNQGLSKGVILLHGKE